MSKMRFIPQEVDVQKQQQSQSEMWEQERKEALLGNMGVPSQEPSPSEPVEDTQQPANEDSKP
jgi:hypothetical protein